MAHVSLHCRFWTWVLWAVFCAGFVSVSVPAWAQAIAPYAPGSVLETPARALDAATLEAQGRKISLWGVEKLPGLSGAQAGAARSVLDNTIGKNMLRCQVRSSQQNNTVLSAQCSTPDNLDLSLFMLQQGYVTAARGQVMGGPFEDAYVGAETQAQTNGAGVWGSLQDSQSARPAQGETLLGLGFALFICILVAFAVLSFIIMQGFKKVVDAQEQNIDMLRRERALREKERAIFAKMLDSEIKANKAKIEAYRVVYEELHRGLSDPARPPKYKRAGDLVQTQPALDRAVFDRNTDKLDILGERLSSEVIHFYARIKSKPDFITLEPDLPLTEAKSVVEKGLKSAQRLNEISDRLIHLFAQAGHASENE
jgi:hypothetical protein